MAVTASGLFFPTFRDQFDVSNLGLDLDLETHKVALFDNTITPAFGSDTAYGVAPYNANEVSGTGWAAGGVVLLGTGISESPAGTFMWDATDVSEATTTLTDARACLIYDAVSAGDEAIVLVDFTADYSTVAGTFAITWDVLGIFTIDLTPA